MVEMVAELFALSVESLHKEEEWFRLDENGQVDT